MKCLMRFLVIVCSVRWVGIARETQTELGTDQGYEALVKRLVTAYMRIVAAT